MLVYLLFTKKELTSTLKNNFDILEIKDSVRGTAPLSANQYNEPTNVFQFQRGET